MQHEITCHKLGWQSLLSQRRASGNHLTNLAGQCKLLKVYCDLRHNNSMFLKEAWLRLCLFPAGFHLHLWAGKRGVCEYSSDLAEAASARRGKQKLITAFMFLILAQDDCAPHM